MTTLSDTQRNEMLAYIPQDLQVAIDSLIWALWDYELKRQVTERRIDKTCRCLGGIDFEVDEIKNRFSPKAEEDKEGGAV